jgi:predicted dehydrogenase
MDPEEAPLRIGILGASRVSPTPIVEPDMLTGARLVAVAARERDRTQDFADRYGVERALGSYEDLSVTWRSKRVHNPLDNSLHARWNLAATAAGKHVLSEKPFRKRSRSQRSAGRSKRAGVKVVHGFRHLYHPVTKRLHELGASGELGELQRVETLVMIPPATRRPPVVSATRGRSAHGPGLLQPPCHPGHGPPGRRESHPHRCPGRRTDRLARSGRMG